jgi:catechol 2,3-dioxygenase-like lactoylglutathione lyase family enzyme
MPAKTFCFLPFLLFAASAPAHPQAASPEPAFTARGAFFAVSVRDLDASAAWYGEKLGLKVTMQVPKRDGTAMRLLQGGGLTVELIEDDAAVPLKVAAPAIEHDYRVHGIFKAGLFVEDWDRLVATLRQRGVEIAIGPFPPRPDQPANLIVRDNEGNPIQFFGRLAEGAD